MQPLVPVHRRHRRRRRRRRRACGAPSSGKRDRSTACCCSCRSSAPCCARSSSRASRARSARCSRPACRSSTRSTSARRPPATRSSQARHPARARARSAKVTTWPGRSPSRKVFPPMVVQMIGVGEQTGAMDQMLQKIADFYEDEVDVAVAALTVADRADHDGVPRRRRRRPDHRDVPADLQAGR